MILEVKTFLLLIGLIPFGIICISFCFVPCGWVWYGLAKVKKSERVGSWAESHESNVTARISKLKEYPKRILGCLSGDK